jgi:AcrR family transcriptional regulator
MENEALQVFDVLGRRYSLPMLEGGSPTKERILMTSTILFGRKGYEAVSMREIAKAVNIKGASIYNHYQNKEALLIAVLEHLKKLYVIYFEHVSHDLAQANTFKDKLSVLFYEPKRLNNYFTSYGYSLIMREQVQNPLVADTFDFFMSHGHKIIKDCFDDCIANRLVPAFDTYSAALLILNTVFLGITAEVQIFEGRRAFYQPKEMFSDMERFFLEVLGK